MVTGLVTDSAGAPVPGASVRIPELSVGTLTAANGRYTLMIAPARGRRRTVTVEAERAGLGRSIHDVWLAASGTVARDFRLPPESGEQVTVEGRVTDVAGRPVAGAQVNFLAIRGEALTDADGRYRIIVPSERWDAGVWRRRVVVKHPGLAPEYRDVSLAPRGLVVADFRLSPASRDSAVISGIVRDTTGAPRVNVTVRLGPIVAHTVTGPDGRYVLTVPGADLPAEPMLMELVAVGQHLSLGRVRVMVGPGTRLRYGFRLAPATPAGSARQGFAPRP
jgi:hypothetical protein